MCMLKFLTALTNLQHRVFLYVCMIHKPRCIYPILTCEELLGVVNGAHYQFMSSWVGNVSMAC